jgi:hypothetical protein
VQVLDVFGVKDNANSRNFVAVIVGPLSYRTTTARHVDWSLDFVTVDTVKEPFPVDDFDRAEYV